MRAALLILALVALCAVGSAYALSLPSGGLELARGLPAAGPAFVDSYSVSCATSATSLAPSGYTNSMIAVECSAPESGETAATVFVAVGDSGIADPASGTRNSPIICGSGCNKSSWSGNASQAYCRADTGTVTLYCAALVPAVTAP